MGGDVGGGVIAAADVGEGVVEGAVGEDVVAADVGDGAGPVNPQSWRTLAWTSNVVSRFCTVKSETS